MSANGKSSFFRQSSWMVIATFTGGFFMMLTHPVAKKMGDDYASFVSLLRVLIIVGIPFAALQTVFARQSAAAVDKAHEQQLIATTRALLLATFLVWLVTSIGLIFFAR